VKKAGDGGLRGRRIVILLAHAHINTYISLKGILGHGNNT